jgi:hypothetical protein
MVQLLDDINPTITEFIPKPKPELLDNDVNKALVVVGRILSSTSDEFKSRRFSAGPIPGIRRSTDDGRILELLGRLNEPERLWGPANLD